MTTLFNYLLIFNIFAGGFVLIDYPFDIYIGYFFILAFLFSFVMRYREIGINHLGFFGILLVLVLTSLINVCFGNTTIFLICKQIAGILITGVAYYLLIKINEYKIGKLFKIYLRIALIIAAIGIFQELSFFMGFKFGYDFSWLIKRWSPVPATGGMLRINSIFSEPAHFAISMAPAFFISLGSIFKKQSHYLKTKWSCVVILISYILTFSILAYIVIGISMAVLFKGIKKIRNLLFIAIIMSLLAYAAYRFMPEIYMRINDTTGIATGEIKASESHLSVYALTSNAYVAYKSFMDNPLFGHGIGSHPVSYDKFLCSGDADWLWQKRYPLINREDAGSLFLRLISETGLLGLIAVLYFLFRFRIKFSNNYLSVINNAIFVLFIVQLLRQGHYFYNGFIFFVWMYFLAYKEYKIKPV